VHMRLKVEPCGPHHVRSRVFFGPDSEHLANCGELCFRLEEWKSFQAALILGCASPELTFDVLGKEAHVD